MATRVPEPTVFRPRQGNATGISDRFDAGSDVNAVAHQIIALQDDIADMDSPMRTGSSPSCLRCRYRLHGTDPPAWQDPKNWWMVTPNRDRSVSIPRLEEDWEKAKLKGHGEIVRWASQHLNIEIGLALRSDRWVGADYWEQGADKNLTLDNLLERSETVVIGIDGGGLDDLLGLAVLGREKRTRRWLLWSRAWANPAVLDRRKSEVSLLRDFEAAGDLVICKEFGEDVAGITELAQRIDGQGLLSAVALDPFGVGAIVDALYEIGIGGQERVVGITQGWKLSGAIKTAERKLADRTLRHGGQTLMAWAVGNARVEPRGNAIIITKQASGTAKIDPLMAAFNAIAWMASNPASTQPSIFWI